MKAILIIILAGIAAIFVYAVLGVLVFAGFEALRGHRWRIEWENDPEWAVVVLLLWPAIIGFGIVVAPFMLIYCLVDKFIHR